MHLSPDQMILWHHGFLKLNATIAYTWALMLVLAGGSRLITRKLSTGPLRCALSDQMILWHHGFLKLNATIAYTWALMLVLAGGSRLITRKLSTGLERSRWQNLLEILVTGISKQIEEVGLSQPQKYLGFLGTIFLFVATASLCTVIPGYEPPTASLSTTAALALCVFVAVPFFGIEEQGVRNYLKSY